MLLPHAHTLAQARTCLAALADAASSEDVSSAYEHVLIELDRIHCDESPDIYTRRRHAGPGDPVRDRNIGDRGTQGLRRRSAQRRTGAVDARGRLHPGPHLMYGETGTAMRQELAALLRQHRVQQRLGGPPEARERGRPADPAVPAERTALVQPSDAGHQSC